MAWLRTDDGEGMAPWVFRVGNEAYGVYQRLNSYCAQHLTDGTVPAEIARMIAGDVDTSQGPRGVSPTLGALEMVNRAQRDDMGTVTMPYFLESNPSRAQVEADREVRQGRARAAAAARWGSGEAVTPGRRRPRKGG